MEARLSILRKLVVAHQVHIAVGEDDAALTRSATEIAVCRDAILADAGVSNTVDGELKETSIRMLSVVRRLVTSRLCSTPLSEGNLELVDPPITQSPAPLRPRSPLEAVYEDLRNQRSEAGEGKAPKGSLHMAMTQHVLQSRESGHGPNILRKVAAFSSPGSDALLLAVAGHEQVSLHQPRLSQPLPVAGAAFAKPQLGGANGPGRAMPPQVAAPSASASQPAPLHRPAQASPIPRKARAGMSLGERDCIVSGLLQQRAVSAAAPSDEAPLDGSYRTDGGSLGSQGSDSALHVLRLLQDVHWSPEGLSTGLRSSEAHRQVHPCAASRTAVCIPLWVEDEHVEPARAEMQVHAETIAPAAVISSHIDVPKPVICTVLVGAAEEERENVMSCAQSAVEEERMENTSITSVETCGIFPPAPSLAVPWSLMTECSSEYGCEQQEGGRWQDDAERNAERDLVARLPRLAKNHVQPWPMVAHTWPARANAGQGYSSNPFSTPRSAPLPLTRDVALSPITTQDSMGLGEDEGEHDHLPVFVGWQPVSDPVPVSHTQAQCTGVAYSLGLDDSDIQPQEAGGREVEESESAHRLGAVYGEEADLDIGAECDSLAGSGRSRHVYASPTSTAFTAWPGEAGARGVHVPPLPPEAFSRVPGLGPYASAGRPSPTVQVLLHLPSPYAPAARLHLTEAQYVDRTMPDAQVGRGGEMLTSAPSTATSRRPSTVRPAPVLPLSGSTGSIRTTAGPGGASWSSASSLALSTLGSGATFSGGHLARAAAAQLAARARVAARARSTAGQADTRDLASVRAERRQQEKGEARAAAAAWRKQQAERQTAALAQPSVAPCPDEGGPACRSPLLGDEAGVARAAERVRKARAEAADKAAAEAMARERARAARFEGRDRRIGAFLERKKAVVEGSCVPEVAMAGGTSFSVDPRDILRPLPRKPSDVHAGGAQEGNALLNVTQHEHVRADSQETGEQALCSHYMGADGDDGAVSLDSAVGPLGPESRSPPSPPCADDITLAMLLPPDARDDDESEEHDVDGHDGAMTAASGDKTRVVKPVLALTLRDQPNRIRVVGKLAGTAVLTGNAA